MFNINNNLHKDCLDKINKFIIENAKLDSLLLLSDLFNNKSSLYLNPNMVEQYLEEYNYLKSTINVYIQYYYSYNFTNVICPEHKENFKLYVLNKVLEQLSIEYNFKYLIEEELKKLLPNKF